MPNPAELHQHLVNTSIAAPVVHLTFNFTETADGAAITIPLFVAPRKMRFIGGTYAQSVDATAATTYTAAIEVGTQVLSIALDIKTLGAATAAYILPSATSADRDIEKGDIVEVNFTSTGGTETSPEIVDICLEFLLQE